MLNVSDSWPQAEVKKAHMAGEPPISKDNTPERMLVEELQAKIKGQLCSWIKEIGLRQPTEVQGRVGVQMGSQ